MHRLKAPKRVSRGKVETPIFDPASLWLPLDWEALFGACGTIELEVGCGKGGYLLQRAQLHPERCFVGLEYARAYLLTMADRIRKRGIANIRVARCEAGGFVRECVPDASVSAFHLLYPDPWPKKRHHKRRLIQHDFLNDLRRVLIPGGEIDIATDHAGYYKWMLDRFAAWKGTFVISSTVLSTPEEKAGFEGRTNYEIKYLKEGRAIHLLTGRRTGF
jgi:tRNA (guanine-N7-)-methyltransferase